MFRRRCDFIRLVSMAAVGISAWMLLVIGLHHGGSPALALDALTVEKDESVLNSNPYNTASPSSKDAIRFPRLTVVMVVCGDEETLADQTTVAIKSMMMFTQGHVTLIILTDSGLQTKRINMQLSAWPKNIVDRLHLSFRPIWYPEGYEWMKTYRTLCTTERLYLPTILKDEDAVLYVDTDVLFLSPVEDLWEYFSRMNSSQFAAMVAEHEDPQHAFYNTPLNKIPYYGDLGLNAGVMLMNLTRMRELSSGWTEQIHQIYQKYKYAPMHFADQDILNIFFHWNPGKLLLLPCEWNYRSDHCSWTGNTCPSAKRNGVALLHGNRHVFVNTRDLTFRTIFKTFQQFSWEKDRNKFLLKPLETALPSNLNTMCGKNVDIFLVKLKHLYQLTPKE